MNAPKYYFDVTDVLEFARFNSTVSGIQRFSLRIIGYLVEKYGSDSIRLIAYHPTLNAVISADASFLHSGYSFERDTFCNNFALPHSTLKEYLNSKFTSKLKRRLHKYRLKLLNKLTRGKTFRKRGLSIDVDHAIVNVNLSPGDTIVIMGATWDFDNYIGFLKKERETNKVRIVHFVHDLIPLVVPEHVGDNVPDRFCRWLEAMSDCSDLFLVNSCHTKKDLGWFLKRIGANSTDVKVVPLAHEFVCENSTGLDCRTSAILNDQYQYSSAVKIRSHILNMTRVPYVLCVGTIESRKNVWTLANVWKDLQDVLGDKLPRLIFAGRHGCLSEDFDEFIRGTGALCGHIKICERPLDFELEYLYKKCMFTVFPSYYEGWGLPIGESLWLGKTAAVSNTSSMPEVGMDMVEYFDPHSRSSMRDTLIKLITNPELLRQKTGKIDPSRLRSWKQVSEELYAALEGDRQSLRTPTDSYIETGV